MNPTTINPPGPLGFIPPSARNPMQQAATANAMARTVAHSLPVATLSKGQYVRLFDFWKAPEVVADVGFTFSRIHQLTGSCVHAGGTNAVFTSIAAQRLASDNPIQAFLPFTYGNYIMSRHALGMNSKGDGSTGATFAESLTSDGLTKWVPGTDGMPSFTQDPQNGIRVASASVEYDWSTYSNPHLNAVLAASKPHTFGSATACRGVADIAACIDNGYGVTFACDRFIGHASVKGSGSDAILLGKWDTYGPHQQSIHARGEHPQFGPVYWAQNNWDKSTYAADPLGGPVCGCWVLESDVAAAFRYDAEVFGLSHLSWFPAQPRVLDWSVV